MQVPIMRFRPDAHIPQYHTLLAAAADVHAAIDEPVVIEPGKMAHIPSGFGFALPKGCVISVHARSGMAAKFGIGLVNGVGLIDADYRGELIVLLINHSSEPFTVQPEMRVAQIMLNKHEVIEWEVVDSLEATERGEGRFGSSGY